MSSGGVACCMCAICNTYRHRAWFLYLLEHALGVLGPNAPYIRATTEMLRSQITYLFEEVCIVIMGHKKRPFLPSNNTKTLT